MNRLTMFLIALMFASVSAPGQLARTAAVEKARAALDLLLDGKYDEVVSMFSPEIRSAVTAEKLRSGLQLVLRSGSVKSRLDPKTHEVGGNAVVTLPVQFERSTWDFIVTVNSAGELAGFWARPAADSTVPWAPAAYSKPELFRTEEVTVGSGDWRLPGTLALPAGKARAAALVLVHGSGPNDRDESIGPQKPFRDLAEGLASRGIAVLRYEKRTRYAAGKLGSIGNFTVQDETVDDALAAVDLLRGRPEVDPARIFVLGHSLGGYLLPRIAKRDSKIAGLVALAGSARPLEDLIVEQTIYLASLQGNTLDAQEHVNKVKADVQRIKELKADDNTSSGGLLFGGPPSYWLDLRGYDPAAEARSLKQPMLILQGGRDYQVTMSDFALWQKALRDRPDVRFRSFPTLNHLFQAGEGKSTPSEYMAKPGHVAAEVIEEIATWIGKIEN